MSLFLNEISSLNEYTENKTASSRIFKIQTHKQISYEFWVNPVENLHSDTTRIEAYCIQVELDKIWYGLEWNRVTWPWNWDLIHMGEKMDVIKY